MIHRQKIDLDYERKLIANMILSTDFLKEISSILNIKHLKSHYTQTVAEWVLEYYEEFSEAPGKNIQDIYFQKKIALISEEDSDMVATFLSNLSTDFGKQLNNVGFSVKEAIHYLKMRSLEFTNKKISECLTSNNVEEAEKCVSEYDRIELNSIKGINVLTDIDSIQNAFLDKDEHLFMFPGIIGEVLGYFDRGDFISYAAFAKRSKTTNLLYAMQQAVLAGRKVVFISLEMTENQVLRRIWESISGYPRKSQEIVIPEFVTLNNEKVSEGKKYGIKYNKIYREGFPIERGVLAKIIEQTLQYIREGDIKLITTQGIGIKDINNILNNLNNYENFIPDVVFLDYADLLIPDRYQKDYRQQLNDIWISLRNMAKERNIALFTVTQFNRGGANNDGNEEQIAEDIRKIAHVTKMIAINQTKKERFEGIMRLSILAQREGAWTTDHVLCLSCLDIAKPILDSRMANEVDYDRGEYKTKWKEKETGKGEKEKSKKWDSF